MTTPAEYTPTDYGFELLILGGSDKGWQTLELYGMVGVGRYEMFAGAEGCSPGEIAELRQDFLEEYAETIEDVYKYTKNKLGV